MRVRVDRRSQGRRKYEEHGGGESKERKTRGIKATNGRNERCDGVVGRGQPLGRR